MSKKVVHYTQAALIEVGSGAFVQTIDHPELGRGQTHTGYAARTSTVESYDPSTGIFETKNTIYKPNLILG